MLIRDTTNFDLDPVELTRSVSDAVCTGSSQLHKTTSAAFRAEPLASIVPVVLGGLATKANPAVRAHALAQRIGALRPIYGGPVPQRVLQQVQQLSSLDADIRTHFAGVAGDTPEQQARTAASLEVITSRIAVALRRDGAVAQPVQQHALPGGESASLAEQLAGEGRGREIAQRLEEYLDGLVDGAVERERTRKDLLRFSFRRLKAFTKEEEGLDQPAAMQGSRVRLRGNVASAISKAMTVAAVQPHIERVGAGFVGAKGPLQALQNLPRDSTTSPSDEFVGAVAWSYSQPATARPSATTTPGPTPGASTFPTPGPNAVGQLPGGAWSLVPEGQDPLDGNPPLGSLRPGTAPNLPGRPVFPSRPLDPSFVVGTESAGSSRPFTAPKIPLSARRALTGLTMRRPLSADTREAPLPELPPLGGPAAVAAAETPSITSSIFARALKSGRGRPCVAVAPLGGRRAPTTGLTSAGSTSTGPDSRRGVGVALRTFSGQ